MDKPIYLDNHATTPVDPRVLEAMLPYFQDEFGNSASGTHTYGWRARAAVEKARARVASLIGAFPDEIVFTSGATESNNWALSGSLRSGDHALTTAFEHQSVLCCFRHLNRHNIESSLVQPQAHGQVLVEDFSAQLLPNTRLISAMFANNEIGTILPIEMIGQLAKEKGLLFHCDAVQGAGKVPVDVKKMNIDFLSLSAHKMYGPKGVGALFIRREQAKALTPLIHGGGHERGFRAGTLNVPGIVGFGEACEIALKEIEVECNRITHLRDRLWNTLRESIPSVRLNGSLENRLSGNLNISFEGVDGEAMLLHVQNTVALSASSACASNGRRNSHVLTAIGISPQRMQASFRLGIGRFNTEQEIDAAAQALCLAESSARC